MQPAGHLDDSLLDQLADCCIDARQLVDRCGTPAMRILIDMMLLEIGMAIAASERGASAVGRRTDDA